MVARSLLGGLRLGGRRDRAGLALAQRHAQADQPLDVAEPTALFVAAKRDGFALGAGARRSADAVDIGLWDVRDVEVDDVAHALDIDPARRDVGRDEQPRLARPESTERPLARVLRLVAVDRVGGKAGGVEIFHHLVGAVLRAGEDERAGDGSVGEETVQHALLVARRAHDDALADPVGRRRDRSDRNLDRIDEQRARELGDRGRHRRGEEQTLPLLRQHRHDPLDVAHEAEVEHAVGLVEDEDADVLERHRPLRDQVEQAAGGRDDDVDAGLQRPDLPVDGYAAEHQRRGDLEEAGIGLDVRLDLAGQFAGRRQDENAAGARGGRDRRRP